MPIGLRVSVGGFGDLLADDVLDLGVPLLFESKTLGVEDALRDFRSAAAGDTTASVGKLGTTLAPDDDTVSVASETVIGELLDVIRNTYYGVDNLYVSG